MLLGCDRLPESFQLKVDGGGSSSSPTFAGAFLSLITLLTLALYSAYKINILSSMGSSQIVQYNLENHFDETDEFTAQQGLEFALTFYSRKNDSGIIDPRYGYL